MASAKASNDSIEGVNGNDNDKGHVLCSVEDLISRKYDFVVVGGGTSGLCVAARLTENPNITVAVVEAGEDRMNDPAVSIPALMTSMVKLHPCSRSSKLICLSLATLSTIGA